ncbi:hypothetical protein [Streptomyces sp. NPDC088775]|uniref:hypothetical protein n=1 Tax=Streptomyces sp. NPDC088775 TaxID=3365896 RepID=UPI00382788E0
MTARQAGSPARDQPSAQQRRVSRVTSSGDPDRDGVAFWREASRGEFHADAGEVILRNAMAEQLAATRTEVE